MPSSRRLTPADQTISVTAIDQLPNEGDDNQTVMIGGERVEIVKHEMGQKKISRPALKPGMDGFILSAGTPVYVGKRFERTINLPDPRPSYDGVGR